MAGHSKWANIKHRKQAVDAKKSVAFARISREISVLAREESNPEINTKLRKALEKAKTLGMAKEKIQRVLEKSTSLEKENWEEVLYEGYGPFGTAFLIKATTDNRNRTASELRLIFSRAGGNLGQVGSVQWMFERLSFFSLNLSSQEQKSQEKSLTAEELVEKILEELTLTSFDFQINRRAGQSSKTEAKIEAKAELEIFCGYPDYQKLFSFLKELELDFETETSYIPREPIKIKSQEQAVRLKKLLQSLDENSDMQNFYSNFSLEKAINLASLE